MNRPITTLFLLTSVGGKDTSTAIDGASLLSTDELCGLGVLKLEECRVLEHSYLHLRYRVIG